MFHTLSSYQRVSYLCNGPAQRLPGTAKTPGEKCIRAMKYPYKNFILKVLKTFLIEGNYSQGGFFKTHYTATLILYSLSNNISL